MANHKLTNGKGVFLGVGGSPLNLREPPQCSGANSILGVTLRNIISEVFMSFDFAKSVSVVGGKNLHRTVDITSRKNLNNNSAAVFCSFDS